MALSEKDSLEKFAAFERLDRALTVVSFRSWLVLMFFLAVTILAILWSLWGTIPITVSGKAIVFDPESSLTVYSKTTGIVKEIRVFAGDVVKQGQVVAVLENTALQENLVDQKHILELLEQEKGKGSGWPEEKERSLLAQRRTVKQMQVEVDQLIVRAPRDGTIAWVDLTLGADVSLNHTLFSLQAKHPVSSFRIIGFFPLYSGESVKPGMEAKCALDTVDRQKYGMIKGIVKEVLPYPLSATERYMQKIPSEPLREFLLSGSLPVIAVLIEPTLNANTPSGFAWTSRQGPPGQIPEASIGEVMITLENVKPISFVLPGIINRGGKKVTRCASEAQPDQSGSAPNEEAMVKPWPTKRIDLAKPQQADCHLFTTQVNK